MMTLKEHEICPFVSSCKYNKDSLGNCYGGNPSRNTVFNCEFVINGQIVNDSNLFRNPYDKTGKMKVIME